MKSNTEFTKEDYVRLAKLAEQTKEYEDLLQYTREFIKLSNYTLSKEELNLFQTAYKVASSNLRAEVRTLCLIEQNVEYLDKQERIDAILQFKEQIKAELTELCHEIIGLVDTKFSNTNEIEAKITFLKIQADYYRYLIESDPSEQNKQDFTEKALAAYLEAEKLAKKLAIIHPLRLGLILNLAVFYYENNLEPLKAIMLLKSTLNEALTQLSAINSKDYAETSTLLQLIRDNITLWTDIKDDNNENEEDKPNGDK